MIRNVRWGDGDTLLLEEPLPKTCGRCGAPIQGLYLIEWGTPYHQGCWEREFGLPSSPSLPERRPPATIDLYGPPRYCRSTTDGGVR